MTSLIRRATDTDTDDDERMPGDSDEAQLGPDFEAQLTTTLRGAEEEALSIEVREPCCCLLHEGAPHQSRGSLCGRCGL